MGSSFIFFAMDSEYREVDYATYCKKCKHEKEEGYETVCEECLSEPLNLYTERPTRWETKE